MKKEKFNIVDLANNNGCFDLQFRKDTRHERTNSPTYYRWKMQFVITTNKEGIKELEKAKKLLGCGKITLANNQARLSVQSMDDIVTMVLPLFTKNKLSGNKKKDFDLWHKAANIIYKNKGKYLAKWEKNDLLHLMEIHKLMAKYKQKPRKQKWSDMVTMLTHKKTGA
jgi:hypothetical protein